MTRFISFEELPGTGAQVYDHNGGSAARVLVCDYKDAERLCAELLGLAYRVGRRRQRRRAPQRHPSRPHLYCHHCRCEGFGSPVPGPAGSLSYTKARIAAEYRPLERPDGDDAAHQATYLTERREFASMVDRLPAHRLEWLAGPDTGGDAVESAWVVKQAPMLIVAVDVCWWFDAPVTTGVFEGTIGKVNASRFRVLWTNWPGETMLYEGAQIARQYATDGEPAWRVTLRFRFKPGGWNAFPHADLAYYPLGTAAGAQPYATADFTKLLP